MAKMLMPRPKTKRRAQLFNTRRGLFYALYPSNPGSVESDDEGPADAAEDAAEGTPESSEP